MNFCVHASMNHFMFVSKMKVAVLMHYSIERGLSLSLSVFHDSSIAEMNSAITGKLNKYKTRTIATVLNPEDQMSRAIKVSSREVTHSSGQKEDSFPSFPRPLYIYYMKCCKNLSNGNLHIKKLFKLFTRSRSDMS